MDKPQKLVLSNETSFFGSGCDGALVGAGIMVLIGGIALTQTDATLADLVLPMGALSVFWLAWLALHTGIGLIHYFGTRREINHLFEEEIWEHWQFRADEWQNIVTAEVQTMYPEDGAGAYTGAIFSTIAGLVFGAILVGVGKFAIKDEQVMPIIFICAAAVVMLFVGVGLFQPLHERRKARKYQRDALRVREPRVWFGAGGVYHEALGYTSLKELEDVTDHTKTRKTIKFTITVTLGSGGTFPSSTYSQPMVFAVPSGYEQKAAQLVRRYRQERLHD